MALQRTSRTGKTYYLRSKASRTGKTSYFFSLKQNHEPVDVLPAGFEIYEDIKGQLFLRRKVPPVIYPEEIALVQAALLDHAEAWQYRAEAKKNLITVYEANTPGGLNAVVAAFGLPPPSGADKLRHASYMAVLRFMLKDKRKRTFVTERFCFRGSVDDWMYLDGPSALIDQIRKYIKHLGRDSIYEL